MSREVEDFKAKKENLKLKKANCLNIFGVRIEVSDRKSAIEKIKCAFSGDGARAVFTPNPQMLLLAEKDESFRQALTGADLLLPDGIGVCIAAKLLGTPLPERITGIDTAEELLEYASENALSVFLLGARSGTAEKAAEKISLKYPRLSICGVHHGYFEKSGVENEAVIEAINQSGAQILFVCFGAPLQERWIIENKERLDSVKLYMGLGGALDVWSGKIKRAPLFFQKAGLEWLWRILKEPRRITVVFQIPLFLYKVVRHKYLK